jgi:7-cyano-7-deazaguanine synthase in queuosine biosynthesis
MFPQISKQEFIKRLKKRKLENLDEINSIETMLLKNRGYIFKMPKPGEPVILLLSGGLDSITCWAILMEHFHLNVYPISFDRGERRRHREVYSVRYFSELYKKQFPLLYHPPFFSETGGKSLCIPIEKAASMFHPKVLLENLDQHGSIKANISLGMYMALPVFAKMYAEYLYYTRNILIRTIFCSVTLSDGQLVPHQTFTALRSIMAYLCVTSGDNRWQYSSVVFEKENGMYWDKADLIRWADSQNLPLEKTWSCYNNGIYQCGDECITCQARREQFKKSGIKDKTIYQSLDKQKLRYKVNQILKLLLLFNKKKGLVSML